MGQLCTFSEGALSSNWHKSLNVGDMVGVDIKIFQIFLKNVQHFGGEKLIISGVERCFFGFFLKTATQGGGVLEITPVEDESFLKKVSKGV